MNVLITGGAGYIGSELVQYLLDDGHKVIVYDKLMFGPDSLLRYTINPNFFFVKGDVRDTKHLQKYVEEADIIIPLDITLRHDQGRSRGRVPKRGKPCNV